MQVDLGGITVLLIFGFIFGNVATIAGIGGGVMFVPFMTVFFLIPMDVSVGTSAYIILISSGAGFLIYLQDKRTNLKLSLIFGSFSILGAALSTLIFQILIPIDNMILKWIFAFILVFIGLFMLNKAFKAKNENKNGMDPPKEVTLEEHNYKDKLKKGIPLFILAGFLANLIGIGGGIINTPSLHGILEFPIHNATALSTSVIFFTAIFNTIVKTIFGLVDFLIGSLISIGSIMGSITGAKISKKIPKIHLQFFIAIVLVGYAIRMFF